MEAVTLTEAPKKRGRPKAEPKADQMELTPEEMKIIKARRDQKGEDDQVDAQAEAHDAKIAELDQRRDALMADYRKHDKFMVFAPIQRRHAEWLERRSQALGLSVGQLIEKTIRQAFAADSTKGGIVGGATVKAKDFKIV